MMLKKKFSQFVEARNQAQSQVPDIGEKVKTASRRAAFFREQFENYEAAGDTEAAAKSKQAVEKFEGEIKALNEQAEILIAAPAALAREFWQAAMVERESHVEELQAAWSVAHEKREDFIRAIEMLGDVRRRSQALTRQMREAGPLVKENPPPPLQINGQYALEVTLKTINSRIPSYDPS